MNTLLPVGTRVQIRELKESPHYGTICKVGDTGRVIESPYEGTTDFILVEFDRPRTVNDYPFKRGEVLEVLVEGDPEYRRLRNVERQYRDLEAAAARAVAAWEGGDLAYWVNDLPVSDEAIAEAEKALAELDDESLEEEEPEYELSVAAASVIGEAQYVVRVMYALAGLGMNEVTLNLPITTPADQFETEIWKQVHQWNANKDNPRIISWTLLNIGVECL